MVSKPEVCLRATSPCSVCPRLRSNRDLLCRKFGPLILDRSIGYLAGKAVWNRQSLNRNCHIDDLLDLTAPLQVAEWAWNDQMACKLRVENLPFLRKRTDAIYEVPNLWSYVALPSCMSIDLVC